jgi:hypothetical protein
MLICLLSAITYAPKEAKFAPKAPSWFSRDSSTLKL